ncbi:hypothetical protein B0T26DRAFT_746558 [Lasiosphaeria miniovina]|uniref:Uncharacterized protein n=1 Tax=Lasiosphaeria miniovina TaxID=1954250 RepID=A0AA40BI79_9PEZI|nr:uncharacterized protein B0T26DRAFT_746558 [Lasiosphaeria miniovina]KAK0734684.1 hypothetical protein B0T26DRAFT_746558 [Lasiosphaeria miniovina]
MPSETPDTPDRAGHRGKRRRVRQVGTGSEVEQATDTAPRFSAAVSQTTQAPPNQVTRSAARQPATIPPAQQVGAAAIQPQPSSNLARTAGQLTTDDLPDHLRERFIPANMTAADIRTMMRGLEAIVTAYARAYDWLDEREGGRGRGRGRGHDGH